MSEEVSQGVSEGMSEGLNEGGIIAAGVVAQKNVNVNKAKKVGLQILQIITR